VKAALLALVFIACMGPPGPKAENVAGPDGEPALMITCWYGTLECFQLLNERCKKGYSVLSKLEQRDSASIVVRCK